MNRITQDFESRSELFLRSVFQSIVAGCSLSLGVHYFFAHHFFAVGFAHFQIRWQKNEGQKNERGRNSMVTPDVGYLA
jgi:hypothetical protein